MAEPTKAELMSMIIRLDNKLTYLIRRKRDPTQPLNLAMFDTLPTQPKDYFSNKEEFEPAECNKNLSVFFCRNLCKVCTQFQDFT